MAWILELHHIDISGGDACAVIVRSKESNKIKYRALIDAGAEGSGTKRLGAYIVNYLKRTPIDQPDLPFDLIVASHYHNDHMDGFFKSGIAFNKILDIGGYAITYQDNRVDEFTPVNGIGLKSSWPRYMRAYRERVQELRPERIRLDFIEAKNYEGGILKADFKKPVKIPIVIDGEDTGITLTCYCANGVLANGENVIGAQKVGVEKPYDPNDMSVALILEWGEFRYFTAGDLSGDASKTSYYDVEPRLVEYLKGADMPLNGGKINVLKVTHHGSEHSNYPQRDGQLGFLEVLQPEILIHPSNQSKQVPSAIFLQRAYEYIEAVNGRKIFFVNRMDYKQNKGRDKDRFAPLKKLIDEEVTNINYVNVGKDAIRNDNTFAIIVRYSSDVLNDPMLEGNDEQIKKDTYDIIIKKGIIPGVDEYKGRTYTTDIWNVPLEAEQYNQVINELEKFASIIVGWLKEDQERAESTGIDYINQYYPSLNPKNEDPEAKGLQDWNLVNGGEQPIQLESQLVNKMNNLMEGLFKKNKNNIYAVTGSELNEQEELTLNNLIYLNYHQEALNTKLYPRESFWNIQGEPYVEPGNPKKRKGVFESIRAKKVPKKLED